MKILGLLGLQFFQVFSRFASIRMISLSQIMANCGSLKQGHQVHNFTV